MNLNEYEVTTRTIDRSKTWIDVKRRRIYSREMCGKMYNILKKLNEIYGTYDYFIVLYKERPENVNIELHDCYVDNFGRLTICLNNKNWNELGFNTYEEDTQLSINLVDNDNTGCLYRIDN